MYLRTTERLRQVPLHYGFLAGTLGGPSFPPQIRQFLDRVKRNPQDYEAVLLAITLHVDLWRSDLLIKLLAVAVLAAGPGEGPGTAGPILDKTLEELEAIQKEHLRDNQFSRLFTKEKQLVSVVASDFQKRIKEIETRYPRWYEDLLTKALLTDDPREVGRELGLHSLAPEISEQVINSRVPETHYARLGKALELMAENRQKTNATFKKRVQRERKKREK